MPDSAKAKVFNRRSWLRWTSAAGVSLLLPAGCAKQVPSTEKTIADLPLRFPGKVPMRVINDRPPCLESPWSAFQHDLTPNESFYVRWHLQVIPTAIDLRLWRLRVVGYVERPLELTMNDLRRMEPVSLIAVNQCSGNSRSLFQPRVPGAQWVNGAMGNARWTGVRLRDVLDIAGLKAGAVDVAFNGLDHGGLPTIPDYVKSLPVEEARREEVLLAYEMNGQPLPMLNGFPLRLVVPGWYATYWVKALHEITVLPEAFSGYWMAKAYRIPKNAEALETPENLATATIPIHRMNVRSFLTSHESGAKIAAGQRCELSGIAFDGGSGIAKVELSVDGGQTWHQAQLGTDLGRFSFRRWRWEWRLPKPGTATVMCRAMNQSGETQTLEAGWNRSGYMRNVVERVRLEVV